MTVHSAGRTQLMRAKGLGDCARQLLLELDELGLTDPIPPGSP
ncbi:MAG: hypothetical protein ABSG78_20645 [Verrucomicrobiota bacterium]